MIKENPHIKEIQLFKMPDFISFAKADVISARESLHNYLSYKQTVKSLHVFNIHPRPLMLFWTGLTVLGFIPYDPKNKRPDSKAEMKRVILEILKAKRFAKHIVLAVERLSLEDFDPAFNYDEEGWMQRWEKECAGLVIAIYFVAEAIKLAETEDFNHFYLIENYYSTRELNKSK